MGRIQSNIASVDKIGSRLFRQNGQKIDIERLEREGGGILLRGTSITPPDYASNQGLEVQLLGCLRCHCYWSTIVICNCTV